MSQPIYLVTGAHGFIGAWVVKRLLGSNYNVVIFDQSADPHRLRLIMDDDEIARATFLAGDITDGGIDLGEGETHGEKRQIGQSRKGGKWE